MGTSSVSDSVEDEAGDAGSRGEFMVDTVGSDTR